VTTVRRATPEDARAIAEIHVDTWRATYMNVMPKSVLDALDVGTRERGWRRFIERGDPVFVAEQDRVVGFVNVGACRDEDAVGQLYAIYVRPEAWGTGAGLALMNAAVEELARDWDEAVLWVAEENPRARRFYELYGWHADGGRMVDEPAPGAVVAEVRYRLSGLQRR
jgi:L-amino acid N-acyltransferase YncA